MQKTAYQALSGLVIILNCFLFVNASLTTDAKKASSPTLKRRSSCRASTLSPEERVLRSPMAVKALVANSYLKGSVAELWLLDVYKGADSLATALGLTLAADDDTAKLRDRRVNVTRWNNESHCWNSLQRQKSYIVLLEPSFSSGRGKIPEEGRFHLNIVPWFRTPLMAHYDEDYGAAIDFSLEAEKKILEALGWNPWTEWGSCSASCGGGVQIRQRSCAQPGSPGTCPTYNVEQRSCNTFPCKGSVDTLSVHEERYFKPSPSAFTQSTPGRPSAWTIRPGSYLLLPFKQAFGQDFPKEFTIFLTVKPAKDSEGVIFSLNGRTSRQEFISLGLNGPRLELIHSLPNGSKIIEIPTKINDGNWHQLAISVQGGSSVRTYLDCHWLTTQILQPSESIVVPNEMDLIVGYMFQGELEQLTVSDDLFGVSQQCAPNAVPHRDESLMASSPLFPQQQQQQQQQQQHTATTSTLGIATVEIIDGKNNEGKVLSWKSEHPKDSRDYLDEEYVDLDSKDEYMSDEPVNTDEKRINLSSTSKQKVQLEKKKKKMTKKFEKKKSKPEEGSGRKVDDDDDDDDDDDEEVLDDDEGSGNFELEWSSWSTCSLTCGDGQQTRSSRCQDNGYLEECINAGIESKQVRPCKSSPCNDIESFPKSKKDHGFKLSSQQSPPDVIEYEIVTRQDVESLKRKSNGSRHFENHAVNNLKPTHTPKDPPELHTNEIPHVPNYWIPVKPSSQERYEKKTKFSKQNEDKKKLDMKTNDVISKSNDVIEAAKCPCQNGGVCINGLSKCRCRRGFGGKNCEQTICHPECSNGGACVAPDVCSCPDGYTGARCQQAFCYPACQNGGSCVAPFKCVCPVGVNGNFCQEFTCSRSCENGGVCIGPNVCSCAHGFSGVDCRERTCTAHCENGGVCTMPDNLCKCRPGFYGSRCHKRICSRYVAVREPRRRSYKKVVDVEYDSVCGEEMNITCKKTRPEYQTVIKVVYKTAYKCADEINNTKTQKKMKNERLREDKDKSSDTE